MEIDEEKNINLTEGEVSDLKRGLNALVDAEQDQRDYETLFDKLDTWFD